MPKIREEWGPCTVCGRMAWLYSASGLTTRGRCPRCWRDAVNAGLVPEKLYERIRKRAGERET